MRKVIYVGAAPVNNDFVRWHGSKSELAGYKGGDHFWQKIEAATLSFADSIGEILTAARCSDELSPLPFHYYI
jgi:hypothetical protein